MTWTKEDQKKASKDYYNKHKEKILQQQKEYRLKNKKPPKRLGRPPKIQFCKYCGNVIFYKAFKNCKVEDSSGDGSDEL
jgi:hypothetical protein